VPYLVQTHGMLDPWFKRTYPLKHLKKWAYWPWADYQLLRDAQAVLFTCERERELARQSFWLYRAKEQVIAYGTASPPGDPEAQRRAFLAQWPELQGRRLLLFLGRIHPKKGVDLLIDAFAAVAARDPRLHLVVAGPDGVGWQTALEARAKALGVADRICWPGMLSGELKWGAFHVAELFCLPSHQENFGIAVAEALACSLPVAIGEPVNISREVAEAGAGIVHDDTAAGTTAALQEWLELEASEREAMGERGRALFEQRFEIGAAAQQFRLLLERVAPMPLEAQPGLTPALDA
jgi:glycosyltransferase involved in cell wall biosynthesis